MYYKLGPVLQVRKITTNWGIALPISTKSEILLLNYVQDTLSRTWNSALSNNGSSVS